MTIRVRLPDDIVRRVRFAMSPVLEGLWGLHAWRQAEHHPLNHEWVRSMRNVPSPLRRDLARFAFVYQGAPGSIGLPLEDERPGIQRELARLRETTNAQALAFFTRSHYRLEPVPEDAVPPEIAAEFLAAAAKRRVSRDLAERALRQPRETLLAFADVFERFWDAVFAETWERSLPRREQEVRDAKARVAKGGLRDLLVGMWPEVRLHPELPGFSLRRTHEHEISLAPNGHLTLVISFCAWPHVRVHCEQPGNVMLGYTPASTLAKLDRASPPTDLLDVLYALADETRLRMLRFLHGQPRSTQELSALLGVGAPTLSEHLHKLEAAGVLSSRRDGYYVLYELAVDLGELLSVKIDDYLGAPGDSPSDSERS